MGNDGLNVYLAGYHGGGSYPISGSSPSSVTFTNSTAGQGRSQTSTNCRAGGCDVNVTDGSAGAAPGTPHHLSFTVSCAKVCDSNTHTCTSNGGGPITWSGSADCRVP
jgi:hypothetical protein